MLLFLILTLVHADTLIQIQSLWRHGARTPIYCNWNCQFFKEKGWLDGYLTPTGMRQHYVLGTWMRQEYIENTQLLSEIFDPNEIEIVSTDVNRTIMSVMSNMQGMYPAGTGPNVPAGIEASYLKPPGIDIDIPADLGQHALHYQIQAIPVHMKLQMADQQLRGYGTPVCAKAGEWQIENKQSELTKNVTKKASDLLLAFSNEMNIDPATMDVFNLSDYQDTFDSSQFNGFPMPPTLTEETLKGSQKLYPLGIALKLYQTQNQAEIMSSPFFEQLWGNMDTAIEGKKYYKYHIYSAHDVTVQLIAIALNQTSAQCMADWYINGIESENCIKEYPTYATSMIFELWQKEEDKSYYVKLRYDGRYLNICDGKSKECSYTLFKSILQGQQKDFNQECGLIEEPIVEYKVPLWMVILTIIFLIILVILVVVSLRMLIQSKKGQGNQLLSQEEQEA